MDPEDSFVAVKNTTETCVPSVGSDDEDSFVVLETSSAYNENGVCSTKEEVLPPIRTNKVHEMQNLTKMKLSQITADSIPELPAAVDALDAVASSIATITISPDSSFEEIQKQVEELIKENEKLKNIIAQNNLSMKTQYSRFLAYRDEVTTVMKSYKEKFNEAKVCIDKYKEENVKLAGDMEVYINIKKLHEEEIINLKQKIVEPEINHKTESTRSETDSKQVGDKIKDLQTTLAEANVKNIELTAVNEKLRQDLVNISRDVKELESKEREIEKLGNRIKDLEANITQANQKNEESTANICKKEEELLIKQREIEKLTKQLVTTPKLQDDLQNKHKELENLNMEILTLKDTEKRLSETVAKLKIENGELQIQLSSVFNEKEELVRSIKAATMHEQLLKLKDSEIVNLKQEQQRLAFVESKLTEEIKDLKIKLQSHQEKYNPRLLEDFTQSRTQLSIAQRTITALEQENETKVREIEELRKLLQNSRATDDEMVALREQLTVYKGDFEAEKESKTSIKQEKDQLVEDIQNLQKRNRQLQNEIETLRARDQPKPDGYSCPKCEFLFTSYQSLENHVHRCLDLDP